MPDKYHLDADATAVIKFKAELDKAANAERRKARALSNLPPVRTADQQEFLDSVAAKRSDSRFNSDPITGFGSLE